MNVALIGSVSSSWYALDALLRGGVEVAGVLGVDESRGERISDYRSLRERAVDAGVPFCSFIKVDEPAVENFLTQHRPDLLWVIGLSQMIPRRLIDLAAHGGVGFHPTMLPEGRGRAPVAWTILLGRRAAANLFFLGDEADAGDIIVQREVPVLPDDYSEDLIHRTNIVLAEAIVELAPRVRAGDLPRRPQDHSQATYYAKRSPEDGQIVWSQPTSVTYRLIRAAGRPYPGAFSHVRGQKMTIWRARPGGVVSAMASGGGRIVEIAGDGSIRVTTGDASVWLTEMAFENAAQASTILRVGEQLGLEAR